MRLPTFYRHFLSRVQVINIEDMIRLNAFFKVKAGVTTAQVKALADELVELSRKDEGNKGYDLFESTTQPGVFLFCESW